MSMRDKPVGGGAVNAAEILEWGRAGSYGPEVQELFSDPNSDLTVQTIVICFLAMPMDGRKRMLEQMKRERVVTVPLDGIEGWPV